MKVILDWSELELAAAVGLRRQISSMRDQREDKHGFSGPGWTIHIEGACGELAVAKAMGRYWNGSVDTFKEPDVPAVVWTDGRMTTVTRTYPLVDRIQVRTRSNAYYDLIVRPDDADQDVYVLVTGRAPEFEVHGWIRGREAKQEMWLRTYGNRPPAYFVPQSALRRIS